MERTKTNRTPTAILCSDMHLREDTPICWTGDFQKEQWSTVEYIAKLQRKYNCPVIHAGDLFHHWKPSPWLLSNAINLLPRNFYTCYGQHDLPQHNWRLRDKSGVYTLEMANSLFTQSQTIGDVELTILNYNQLPDDTNLKLLRKDWCNILVWHHLTYITKPFPGASDGQADSLLRKYPQFDLIVTGDNHQSFTTEYKGRVLVNPGCMTRQKTDEAEYKPSVYLWYAEDNSVERVYLPAQEGVISREHIEVKEQRDQRIQAFISRLNDDYEADISFEENLERFFKKNKIKDSIKDIIYKAIDNEKST